MNKKIKISIDPEEVKTELLKKYPAKVARKDDDGGHHVGN